MTCAAMLLLTAACSNDENNNGQEKTIQAVQFSFTNEDFGADEALSRATGTAETKPQTVDLGDCEAEISVESEPAVKTRGPLTNANGHYTIRAYQGGTLKGEMKGTFSGGTFTPDPGPVYKFDLPMGAYEFVAFNDDVTPTAGGLTVTNDKVETAMLGTTSVNITSNMGILVNFTMKHVGCRLRTQFVCRKDIPNAITATLEATAANVIPTSVTYDLATKTYAATNGTMAATPNNSAASTQEKFFASDNGRTYSYTSTGDYHYFLPTTEGSKLKLTGISAGTVFWKPIPTFNIPKLNATLQMQAGKSYVVKIKLDPSYTYLMSDGTTGKFKDTTFGDGSKTPIALVLDADNHMAVALAYDRNRARYSNYEIQSNTHMAATVADALGSQATSGLDETWNASYSTSTVPGNKVKALNPDFPAFKIAAEYDPGTVYTGSPALQWYLPSVSDFQKFAPLGFEGTFSVLRPDGTINYYKTWYGVLVAWAFYRVGGFFTMSSYEFWTSTEQSASYAYTGNLNNSNKVDFQTDAKRDYQNYRILSFVKY